MSGPVPVGSRLGFEAFGAAAGLAVVTGALSVIAPFLTVLTGTLAALGFSAWVAALPRTGWRSGRHASAGRVWGLVGLGMGAAVFLAPPRLMEPYRALGLGLGIAALWRAERPTVRPGGSSSGSVG